MNIIDNCMQNERKMTGYKIIKQFTYYYWIIELFTFMIKDHI